MLSLLVVSKAFQTMPPQETLLKDYSNLTNMFKYIPNEANGKDELALKKERKTALNLLSKTENRIMT